MAKSYDNLLGQTSEEIVMKLGQIPRTRGLDISRDSLLSFLSQVVFRVIDEEAESKNVKLDECRGNVKLLQSELKRQKRILASFTSELSRQKQLYRVLTLLETLRREGSLAGQNIKKVDSILETIEERDFHGLRNLEERLCVYLPG